jgi:hypothetical protein
MPASEDFTPLDTLKRYLSLPRRTIEEGLSSLATLPQRAFQASEQMRTEGPYNPAPVVEAALTTMGTGAVAGVKAAAGEKVLGAGPIRAYHSSPHDFDKFDLAKIGTGEGAQVYGHGLYFAENPAVSGKGGQYWQQFSGRFHGPEREALDDLFRHGMDPEKALAATQKNIADKQALLEGRNLSIMDRARYADQLAKSEAKAAYLSSDKPFGPRTYEVNINADPAHMLDWDRPLKRQSPEVVEGLQRAMNPTQWKEFNMSDASTAMKQGFIGSDMRTASRKVADAGIPGIKYLDQGSRGAGTGSSNYVVFDPSIIDIMKKYGLAGLAPAGIGAKAAAEWYPPNPGSQP